MVIGQVIGYAANIVWLLIPLRQIRTNYFFFFLIYAITSGILLLDDILLIHPAKIYFGQGIFLIISLYNFKKILYYKYVLIAILIVSVILPLIISVNTILIFLIASHVTIFLIILRRIVLYSSQQEKLNLFHFILLLFEASALTRFIVVIGDIKTGVIFFYLTAAFGILIGIYFLIYNEKNSFKFSLNTETVK